MIDKFFLGKWFWVMNNKNESCYLANQNKGFGWYNLMDFVRFGFQGGQAAFLNKDGILEKTSELNEPDYNGDIKIDHPVARLIQYSPDMYKLLSEVKDIDDRIKVLLEKIEAKK